MKTYFIYIITNKPNGTLYIGVTNDLERRTFEHRKKIVRGFSSKYNLDRVVYIEDYSDIDQAIAREKQLKNFTREKKIKLIEGLNSEWRDLML
jgi:putative endonuclease